MDAHRVSFETFGFAASLLRLLSVVTARFVVVVFSVGNKIVSTHAPVHTTLHELKRPLRVNLKLFARKIP